jgi:dTDP-4-amino-4,6-dideoxygalactose transaminase
LLLVHLFGHSADMDAFASLCSERGITLVEDAAQSIGATWLGRRLGSLGRAGILSFYPTKNLSALGNAGALLTGDSELATRARMLASHGQSPDGRFTEAGFNSHLDELQAAFLRAKLAHLDIELARRRAIAARYDAELPFPPHPSPPIPIRPAPGCVSSYHQYAVRTSRRDALRRFLAEQGIGTGDYYRTPLHREPALAGRSRFTDLTETELACRETLTLPVRPSLSDDDVAAVVAGVQAFFAPRRPRPACPEPEPAAA